MRFSRARIGAGFAHLFCLLAFAIVPASAGASIVGLSSNLTILLDPPVVGANFLINEGLPNEVVLYEQQNMTLTSSLAVDLGGAIPAGTTVSSYFFALNTPSRTTVTSWITFNAPVLGIVYMDGSPNWALTDFLGMPGTVYTESTCGQCGFELQWGDTASFSGDTASFFNRVSDPGDFARIIVGGSSSTTPEPATVALLASALVGLGAIRWMRRNKVC